MTRRVTNFDRVAAVLKAGPASALDIMKATGFREEIVGTCLCNLRKKGRVVKLVETREDYISNGPRGRRRILRALYGLPSSAPFIPYSPRTRGGHELGPTAAPSPMQRRARMKSSSGQIAGKCISRQYKWFTERMF